jgi:hypothetical protein
MTERWVSRTIELSKAYTSSLAAHSCGWLSYAAGPTGALGGSRSSGCLSFIR